MCGPPHCAGQRCTSSQNTSSQPWNTTTRPMKRTPGELPRQPFVRQVPLQLRRCLFGRRRHSGLAHRLATLRALRALKLPTAIQVLELDQVAALQVRIAGHQWFQRDVRMALTQLRLRAVGRTPNRYRGQTTAASLAPPVPPAYAVDEQSSLDDATPSLRRVSPASPLLRVAPPLCLASVLSSWEGCSLDFSLAIEATGSHHPGS